MEIRKSNHGDISAIVSLLKKSLGETLMPKSEAYWRWKHVENPFGESPVLLALEGDTIIGVRAFMQWKWTRGNRIFKSVRAVDTATDPDHQGKGIFTKLTKQVLKNCEDNGVDFVFNTPNGKSKPGYLKMGWEEAGRLPVNFHIRPLNVLLSKFSKPQEADIGQTTLQKYLAHPRLGELLGSDRDCISTAHTPGSLEWRYLKVPVVKYFACGVENGNNLDALLFYRIKPTGPALELRVTDAYATSNAAYRELLRVLVEDVKRHRASFVTESGFGKIMPHLTLTLNSLRLGPIVTVRRLNMDIEILKHFRSWSPSLGDLELF